MWEGSFPCGKASALAIWGESHQTISAFHRMCWLPHFSTALYGALYAGEPERAYCAAYEAAFFDVAYAREATALLAASQSLALAGIEPREIIERTLALDPLRLGDVLADHLLWITCRLYLRCARGKQGVDLADFLSFELRHLSAFDPYRHSLLLFALLAHADEPIRAL